ncbi:MAG: aldo/keto reductase [Clostridiales bacterium]|nr:aldo/keto reductase [Clostridiales bacterium]
MQYRTMRFQKAEDKVSLLGFGCMRFPKTESGNIDQERAGKMLDMALKAGVNYIDTAYPYHDGESEPFLGRILAKYARDSYYLATKLPVWLVNTADEAQAVFDEQLDRLQVSYVDYYLFHALNRERWEKLKGSGIIEWAQQLKQEGKIRHLGFSFHDDYEVFREIITYRQWDFCQIQYNYMDRNIQAGDRGYELASKMGIPVIVMEPVKGGMLSGLPEDAQAILEAADPGRTPASWALRWVGSHPGVKLVLSGMSSEEQLEDNIKTFSPFVPLSREEENIIEQAAQAIRTRIKNGCTACRYCMPCPAGGDIPGNFAIWNEKAMYDVEERARKAFKEKQEAGAGADLCIQCGKCEKVCPQGIGIRKDLAALAAELGDGNAAELGDGNAAE